MKKVVHAMLLGAVALGFSGCYFTTISDSEVGVEVVSGKVNPKYIGSGFHMSLNPFADLYTMNAKGKTLVMTTAEAAKDDTAESMYERPVTVITTEKLSVPIDVSILYSLRKDKAVVTRTQYGDDTIWEEKLLVKTARSVIRDAIGSSASVYGLNENRPKYEKAIFDTISAKLGDTIVIAQVNIMDIPLPAKIKEQVEDTLVAQQAAVKEEYNLKKVETQALIAKATAEGEANAQREISRTITPALLEYKRLENERMQIELYYSKWDGHEPVTKVTGQTSGQFLTLPSVKTGK